MDLLDRYVSEVGRRLPEKMRLDIEREIRSILQDNLEDRSRTQERPVDEGMMTELLTEYGSPDKVAASYLPPRCLIGPRWFPTFSMVLRIVLVVIVVLAAVQFGLGASQAGAPADLGRLALQTLGGLWTGAMTALGTVVLVFSMLQWTQPAPLNKEEKWDPAQLEDQPEPDRAKMGDLIAEMIFSLLAIVVFTFYFDKLAIYSYSPQTGTWAALPFLSDVFLRYLPWMVALWILKIACDALVLRQGQWTQPSRWFSVGVSVLDIILTAVILTGPALLKLSAQDLLSIQGMQITPATAGMLVQMTNAAVRLGLGVALVVELVELGQLLYRLLFRPGIKKIEARLNL